MGEYIDRNDVVALATDYGEGQNVMMLIDPKLVKKIPDADVIERSEYIKSQKEVLRLEDLFHKANQNAMEYEGMYRELLSKIDKARAEILKNIYTYSGSGSEVTQAYYDGFKDSLEIVIRNMGE